MFQMLKINVCKSAAVTTRRYLARAGGGGLLMSRQSTISRVKVLHQSRQTTEKVWLYIGQLFAVQRQIITMHTQNHISFIMFCNIVTTVDGFNRKQFTTKAEYQH